MIKLSKILLALQPKVNDPMKKRPLLFTLLSISFMLYTPLTLLVAMLKLDLPLHWTLETLKLTFKSPYILYYWLIPSMICLSLIKMRKYSYPIFMTSQLLALVLPITSKKLFIPELLNESSITIYFLQFVAFTNIALFIKKDFVALFLNHSLRPWEWAKRIKTEIPFSIKSKESKHIIDAYTLNISTSGILFYGVNPSIKFQPEQKLLINLSYNDCEISLPIKVIRIIQKDGLSCYGAKFNHRGIWQFYQLKRLVAHVSQSQNRQHSTLYSTTNKAA